MQAAAVPVERNFWNFLKNPGTISQISTSGKSGAKIGTGAANTDDLHIQQQQLKQRHEVLVVPVEASLHGGDPIFILLPQTMQTQANSRYFLVYEGSRRRHLASCEFVFASKALFSRVPEHDLPERVQLTVFEDSRQVESLEFVFTRDQLLSVARDLIDTFPIEPPSLLRLRRDSQQSANGASSSSSSSSSSHGVSPPPPVPPLDADHRLSAALKRLERQLRQSASPGGRPQQQSSSECRIFGFSAEQYLAERSKLLKSPQLGADTVFHSLAESGWLESLAHLLRLTAEPESWLALQAGSDGAGRTVLQLVKDKRFHSVLSSPHRLRAWLNQLDGQASRVQDQEEAVVKVSSWDTPAGSALIIMTTNKEKADTPLEQDLTIFPTLEAGHMEDHYLLKSPQTHDPASLNNTAVRETACAQTEVGKSIEDLIDSPEDLGGLSPRSPAVGYRVRFAETDSLVVDLTGEMSMSHSMSQSVIFHDHLDSPSSPCDAASQQRQLQYQEQHQQLVGTSRSVSTPTLFADVVCAPSALDPSDRFAIGGRAESAADPTAILLPPQLLQRGTSCTCTCYSPAVRHRQMSLGAPPHSLAADISSVEFSA